MHGPNPGLGKTHNSMTVWQIEGVFADSSGDKSQRARSLRRTATCAREKNKSRDMYQLPMRQVKRNISSQAYSKCL